MTESGKNTIIAISVAVIAVVMVVALFAGWNV